MASPAKQTPKHVFKAPRNRRLAPSEQNGVLARYLRWQNVNAELRIAGELHRNLHSALTVAALITAAPASTLEHGALSNSATPECERAVIHQRARDAHLVGKHREIAQRVSARRRSARPSSRSLLPRRRPTRRPQHLARRRCASLTSIRSSATWPQVASQLSRAVGLLAKSLATLGRSRSRVASARRRSARSLPPTSLASLDRFSLGGTSVAGEKTVLLLLLLMQLHTTQLRPQRRRSRRSRQHAEAAEAAVRRRSSTTKATTPVATPTTMTTAAARASLLIVTST